MTSKNTNRYLRVSDQKRQSFLVTEIKNDET